MSTSRLVTARAALTVIFFVNGAVLASWAPRIPDVKSALGLSEPALGMALFGVAAGSVPTLLITGRLLRHVPVAQVCRLSAAVFPAALPLVGVVDDAVMLTAVLALLGAGSGALDVAMNTAAVGLERRTRRPLMSGFHGAYSGGVLTGAVLGGLAAAGDLAVTAHFAAVSVGPLLLLGSVWPALRHLALPAPSSHSPAATASPRRPLLMLVPLAVCALFLEGTVLDWSAVLASQPPVDSARAAAAVVAAFSAAMTLSRSLAGHAIRAWGSREVVTGASLTLLLVVPVTVVQNHAALLVGGVVVAGVAIGPLFPIVMSAAGESSPHDPGAATATVTAGGYLAFLAGPPTIGLLAGSLGLPATLALAGGLASAVIAVLGRAGLRPDGRRRRRAQPACPRSR